MRRPINADNNSTYYSIYTDVKKNASSKSKREYLLDWSD